MGNRCTITTPKKDIYIYLHRNGGRDSVEAFLEYCRLRRFRSPSKDSYGLARLAQVIANFIGGGMGIGIGAVGENINAIDPGDNGCYVVGDNWKIVEQMFFHGAEQNFHNLSEMLLAIDEAQPESDRLGENFLKAEEIQASLLIPGDTVFIFDSVDEKYCEATVLGYGKDEFLNGKNVAGVPYTNLYAPHNVNAYIFEPTVRRVPKNTIKEEPCEIPLF